MTGMVGDTKVGERFFTDVLGTGDWSGAGELMTPGVVMHHPSSPEPVVGFDAVRGFLSAFRAGFPDMHMSVEDAFAGGDKVAVRWAMKGTHNGDLFGIPPTGRSVAIQGVSLLRMEDGKIAEDWVIEDTLGLMRQLGVIPG
jgi:steroid delta-isomerase-like uncharacterized protein